jgi:hypothetical protein
MKREWKKVRNFSHLNQACVCDLHDPIEVNGGNVVARRLFLSRVPVSIQSDEKNEEFTLEKFSFSPVISKCIVIFMHTV